MELFRATTTSLKFLRSITLTFAHFLLPLGKWDSNEMFDVSGLSIGDQPYLKYIPSTKVLHFRKWDAS